MIAYELGRGLAYRRIIHPEMHWYTRTIPMALCFIIYLAYLAMPASVPVLGKDGILASTLSVLSTLPGFYFAGLAAVATFNGLNMDAVMNSAPKLTVRQGNHVGEIDLSRRQFLSYLFAYLVILSFGICVAILALNAFEPTIRLLDGYALNHEIIKMIWNFLKEIGFIGIIISACSMVVTTLHGIYFLTERIHQP